MAEYPFLQVDAFTTQKLAGNGCTVIFETDDLDDQTMQAIARETKQSETAFVRASGTSHFAVRYFTPSVEIPLAGHPTIATAHALVHTGRIQLRDPLTTISLQLIEGPINVDLIAENGKLNRVVMEQRKPIFSQTHDPEKVMPIFGLTPADLIPDVPIQTVSTGTRQLMVPLNSKEALRRAIIDPPSFNAYREQTDFFSPHLFTLGGVTDQGHTFARHLDTAPDLAEDPFTGSATGGMAAYLWRYNLIHHPTFVAEQGHWMHRPGQAQVEISGDRERIQSIRVGGPAVTVMEGKLFL